MSYDRPKFDIPFLSDPISPLLTSPEFLDNQNPVDETNSLNQIAHELGISSSSHQPENFSLCQTTTHLQNASYPTTTTTTTTTQFPDSSALEAKTAEFRQLAFQFPYNSQVAFQPHCDGLMESPNFQPQVMSSLGNSFSTGQMQMVCSTGESQNIQTTQRSYTERSLLETDFGFGGNINLGIDNQFLANAYDDMGQSPNVSSLNLAKVSSSKKVQQSRSNFTSEEDILLISAYLNMDTVQGNQHDWKRIHDYFHENKKFNSVRSQDSLKNRWSRIRDDVEKFSEYYAQIEGRQQCGVTEQDKILQALKVYGKKQGRPFQLQHCWRQLRRHPKWAQAPFKKNTQISKNVSSTMSTPSTADPINLGEDDTANDVSANLEWPIDRKAQKKEYVSSSSTPDPINLGGDATANDVSANLKTPIGRKPQKRKYVSSSSTPDTINLGEDAAANDVFANLERPIDRKAQKKEFVPSIPTSMFSEEYTERMRHERLERLYRQVEALIALEKEASRSQMLREEQRIMAIDTTTMEQNQAQYYEIRKKGIMAQRKGTDFH